MNDFNEQEIRNIISLFNIYFKIKKVKIKSDIINILKSKFPEEDYSNFPTKYLGKDCYIFQEQGNYFILEDDNYILTKDCFEEEI